MFFLLRWAFVLVLCLGGIGLYRGWFSFNNAGHDPQSDRVNINLSVDENKMQADLKTAEERLAQKVAQQVHQIDQKAKQ